MPLNNLNNNKVQADIKQTKNHITVPNYPSRSIVVCFYEGFCNLSCPKCPAHGLENKKNTDHFMQGEMPLKDFCNLLDELEGTEIVLTSPGYTEPLVQKNMLDYLREIKKRGLKISLNTNGVVFTKKHAEEFIKIGVDSIFFSIDATTKETLLKTRTTDKLEKIHEAIFILLELRGDKPFPRIGVSFSEEESNLHEKEEFITYWIKHVDAIRVNKLYAKGPGINAHFVNNKNRKPCKLLYENMYIHHNGDVSICCLDDNAQTNIGNVFKEGIKGVWLGKNFQQIRHYHETGQFEKVPYCANCQDWQRYQFSETEEIIGNVLIRRSPLMTYYNNIKRLETWKFGQGPIITKK